MLQEVAQEQCKELESQLTLLQEQLGAKQNERESLVSQKSWYEAGVSSYMLNHAVLLRSHSEVA